MGPALLDIVEERADHPDATVGVDRLRDRLLEASVVSVARVGVAKTTVAEVAKLAGCSRATAYRVFSGKHGLLAAAASRELTSFEVRLGRRLDRAPTLEEALVIAVVESYRELAGHRALQFVLRNEPGVVLPFFGFHHTDEIYAAVGRFAVSRLSRFLEPTPAAWAGEWVARTVLSHLFHPGDDVRLGHQPDARRLVIHYLMPALMAADGTMSAPTSSSPNP